MRQADIFLESEGDAYFQRNRGKAPVPDPVIDMIVAAGIKPKRVLEVGCGNGARLAALRDKYGCEIFGVEPSMQACMEAAQLRVPALQSSAVVLPVTGQFDLVIYGFCLYLTDPADWLRIAAEGDCVLAPGGHLIVHDFSVIGPAFARRYEHRDGLRAYHVDFARLWLAHPLYEAVTRVLLLGTEEEVSLLRKCTTIPVRP